MYRYATYRLYPTKAQARRMEAIIDVCLRFANVLLDERRAARHAGEKVGLVAQLRRVAAWRLEDAAAAVLHSHVLQCVCKDVDAAWWAWLRKGKDRKGDGPHQREAGDVRGFGFKEAGNGFGICGRRLRLSGVGRVAVRWHRPLEGEVRTLRIYREAGRWHAAFCCLVEPQPLPPSSAEVGVDVGTGDLLVLSSGERIANPRFGLQVRDRLAALRARLAGAVPGSSGHRKALLRLGREQVKVARRRLDYIAKAVAGLAGAYGRIAVEDLDTARLSNTRPAVSDAGWGAFRRLLLKKAEATGRTVTFVPAAWTSQTCSGCGGRSRRHLPLSERTFVCGACGLRLDRDVNAARVVLARAREMWDLEGETAGPQPGQAREATPEAAAPLG